MKTIITLFILLLLSCNADKKDKINDQTAIGIESDSQLTFKSRLQEIETLSFRRSYVGHENLSKKELAELYKSNPYLETNGSDSKFHKKLSQLSLITTDGLVLSEFENKYLQKDYLDANKKIELTCKYDSLNMSGIDLLVNNETKKDLKTIDVKGDHLIGIILKDIDDDNVKEILLLTNYYVMNGDNYILRILKYK